MNKLAYLYDTAKINWPTLDKYKKFSLLQNAVLLFVCIIALATFHSYIMDFAFIVGIITACIGVYSVLINKMPKDMLEAIDTTELIIVGICCLLYAILTGIYWLAFVTVALVLFSLFNDKER